MVYIRTKKVKGENYLYLVKSVWDKKNNTSRQEIIKYLGNAVEVTPHDIPIDYRNDPKINAFLSSNIGKVIGQKEELLKKLRKDVFKFLTNGNLKETLNVYETYTRTTGLDDFYENVLKPVMYEIGELWATNKLSVATEHISSNIAQKLVSLILEKNTRSPDKGKILICTPNGEEHNLGCNVLESYLTTKGFKIFNLSPSAPAESIMSFIEKSKPDLVIVSITLPENIKTGQRLVKKIFENYNIPIFVGGQAVEKENSKFNAFVIKNQPLSKTYKLVKEQIS